MARNSSVNFTQEVVRRLSHRAGTHCSNPDCRVATIGANENPDKTTNIGVAAHITAASKTGPRYNPDLSDNQRRDYDNGIWLCQSCHKIVDDDERRFPVERLKQWKIRACPSPCLGTNPWQGRARGRPLRRYLIGAQRNTYACCPLSLTTGQSLKYLFHCVTDNTRHS